MTELDPIAPPSAGRLALNARAYKFDPALDPIADRLDQGEACTDVHPLLLDKASIYRDFRTQYRAAVDAGAITERSN